VDEAARIVAETSRQPSFQMTPESKRLLNDRVLASQVEALLLEEFPRVVVTAQNGEAFVRIPTGFSIHTLLTEKAKIIEKVEAIAVGLGGAEKTRVSFDHPI
jgi:hypothetical protein